jgi:hypothetical protein
MKRTAMAFIIILALSFSTATGWFAGLARANFSPSPIDITINSPTNNGNTTSTVSLKVTITVFLDLLNTSENRWIAYSLDGQDNVTMSPNYQGISGSGEFQYSTVTAEGTLFGLSEGWHSLAVFAKYDYGNWVNEGAAKIKFSVGTPAGLPPPDENTPIITLNYPSQDKNFEENSVVPFLITITKPIGGFGGIRTIGYTLDKSRTIVAGENLQYPDDPRSEIVFNGSFPAFVPPFMGNSQNITLSGYLPSLPTGSHKMQIFVFYYDPMGKYAQKAVSNISYFSVGNQTIQPPNQIIEPINQPFTITIVIASTVSATIIALGLLVYFKKHKRKAEVT